MRVIHIDDVPAAPVAGDLFPAGEVIRRALVSPRDSTQLSFTQLRFTAGAGNAAHTHSNDQVLFVTAGTGVVGAGGKERQVTAADIVVFPAGESHFHAASRHEGVTFVSVTPQGTTTWVD